MSISFPYLIEVSLCIAVFYLLYVIVLRRFTFFTANRFYLLTGLLLSFVIPVLTIPLSTPGYEIVFKDDVRLASFLISAPMKTEASVAPNGFSWIRVVIAVYMLGVLFLSVKFVASLRAIYLSAKKGVSENLNGLHIIRLPDIQPYSFGRWIFLPEKHTDQMIIAHEQAHIIQRHWIDLIIVEVVKCILWFNPVVYWYKRAIQLQHEYLADEGALSDQETPELYLHVLMRHLHMNAVAMPVNHFHNFSIKKRILMMTQSRTSPSKSIWYAMLLPVVAILLASFAFTTRTEIQPTLKTKLVSLPVIFPQDNVPSLMPVDASKLKTVMHYGQRMHPYFKKMKMHTGIDFIIEEGVEIIATADGSVTEAGFDSGRGNYVIIKHGETYSTLYMHMKAFTVKKGQTVKAGETIGTVGSTGLSTGPHLHYEVYEGNKQVDPKRFLPGFKK